MAAVVESTPSRQWALALLLGLIIGLIALSGSTAVQLGFLAAVVSLFLSWFVFTVRGFGLSLLLAALILLPPLPIPLGDSGPHPAIAIAALCMLAGIARLNEWRIPATPINLSWAALVGAMTLSLGFALFYSGPAVAAASAARVGLFSTAPFVFLTTAYGPDHQSPREAVRLAKALFYIAIFAAALGAIDFFFQLPAPAGFGPQFVWLDSGVFRRAQGLFYESSTLGNFCAFFLVMAAVALTEPKDRRPLPAMLLCAGAAVLATALILSYSRASAGAVIISLITLMLLRCSRREIAKLTFLFAAGAAAAVAFSAFLWPEFTQSYLTRLGFSLENLWTMPDRVFSGRLGSWSVIVSFIQNHPWQSLLGIGYKTLPYSTYLGTSVIADNTYLSTLVETGVPGLAALLSLHACIFALCWRARRNARSAFFATWMFCFWAGESVQMLFGDLLTYWRILPIFCWVLAHANSRD